MDDATIKFGLLMETAQTHQHLAEVAVERLRAHLHGLDAVVRDEIRRTLIDELHALTSETKGAAQAIRALKRAANLRLALWGIGIVTVWCAVSTAGVVAAASWLLPSSAQSTALRARHDALVLGISRLEEQGGRIDLRRCGEPGRLCIRVDRKAPVFGPNSDYVVVAGY
jgi:hypothetical protein